MCRFPDPGEALGAGGWHCVYKHARIQLELCPSHNHQSSLLHYSLEIPLPPRASATLHSVHAHAFLQIWERQWASLKVGLEWEQFTLPLPGVMTAQGGRAIECILSGSSKTRPFYMQGAVTNCPTLSADRPPPSLRCLCPAITYMINHHLLFRFHVNTIIDMRDGKVSPRSSIQPVEDGSLLLIY